MNDVQLALQLVADVMNEAKLTSKERDRANQAFQAVMRAVTPQPQPEKKEGV